MPGLHIADLLVRGRITWDDNEDDRLSMRVIGGREISWEQFGRMVMGFEGRRFRKSTRIGMRAERNFLDVTSRSAISA